MVSLIRMIKMRERKKKTWLNKGQTVRAKTTINNKQVY